MWVLPGRAWSRRVEQVVVRTSSLGGVVYAPAVNRFRRRLFAAFLLLAACPGNARAEVGWRRSFAAAQAEAQRSKKPLFVEFTLPGCAACARLEASTYPAPEVAAVLRDYVAVKVDMTVDEVLAGRYGVESSPDLFVLTADGDVINRITRYVAPADLAEFLAAGLVAPERARPGTRTVPWAKSFAEAERASRSSGKPIFVYVWNYG